MTAHDQRVVPGDDVSERVVVQVDRFLPTRTELARTSIPVRARSVVIAGTAVLLRGTHQLRRRLSEGRVPGDGGRRTADGGRLPTIGDSHGM
jgi:hypothetical protein